ncbi:MAG: hypothetical protein K0M48_07185 [Thiobacillus sp.]|nr:hypothetical protein [Thiobacillus sp.]
MHTSTHHLNDEHMRLYEWSGAVMQHAIPTGSKRTHPWHASYSVLALLTSLLILNGCDNKGQAVQDMKKEAGSLLDDTTAKPGPAEEAGRTLDETREQAGEKIEQIGEDLQKP